MIDMQIDIIGKPKVDMSHLIQEVQLLEKKLHLYYDEARVIVSIDVSVPKKNKTQIKSHQKKIKKKNTLVGKIKNRCQGLTNSYHK